MKITVSHQVTFNEMDPMGVVWHGNYVNYFELARYALLEKIGYTYNDMAADGYAWPVVKLRCKYMRSAVLGQRLHITAKLEDYLNTITLSFVIKDAESGAVLTKGETVQMAVDAKTGEGLLASPRQLVEKVEAYMASTAH